MSQYPSEPKSKQPAAQPKLTELSAEELDRVTGGDQAQTTTQTTTKPTLSDFHFTKIVDKTSPS